MSYLDERRAHIQAGRPLPEKNKNQIRKVSIKRQAKIDAQKELGTDSDLDKFYDAMRKKMVGVCQCGCGQPSQKSDDTFFRHCICHVFPKKIFKSIATHELNWVERTFWGGHHTNFDEQGLGKWPQYADWNDIQEKFHVLAELLTDEERKTKFYTQLEKLVYVN